MLFVGDDWAEDHHDIEIVDEQGRRLARRRLPEGLDGVTRLHALIAGVMPQRMGRPASIRCGGSGQDRDRDRTRSLGGLVGGRGL